MLSALPKLQSLNGVRVFNDDISIAASKRTNKSSKRPHSKMSSNRKAQSIKSSKRGQHRASEQRNEINSNNDYKIKN